MRIPPRLQNLASIAALSMVATVGSLLSCSGIRDFYARGRPDGNMREVEGTLRVPTENPKIKVEQVALAEIPFSPITMSEGGGVLYLSGATRGFATLDIRNPASPRLGATFVGMIAPEDPRSRSFLAALPEPDRRRLIVMDRIHGIMLWDASDPLNPVPATPLKLGSGVNEQALVMRKIGDYYYLASGAGGLRRIGTDLTPTTEAKNLLPSHDHTRDVVFYPPHWLLVADGHDSGLQILDISDPSEPVLAAIFSTTTYCDQALAAPPYALLASRGLGVAVVDMREPARPVFTRYYFPPTYSEVKSMAMWRNRYLVTGCKGTGLLKPNGFIQIYDMKDPAKAVLEARIETSAEVNAVVLAGDYLIGNLWSENRVMIFRLSET